MGVFNNFARFCFLISLCGLIDHQLVNAGVIQSEEETVENAKVFREQARKAEPPQLYWGAATKEDDLAPLEEAPPLPEEELPVPKEVSNVLVEDVPEEESHVPKGVPHVVNVNGGAVESESQASDGCKGQTMPNVKGERVCQPCYQRNKVMDNGGFLLKRDKDNGCHTCCYCEHKCKCTPLIEKCELDNEGCPLEKSNGEHICKPTEDAALPEKYYKEEANLIV